MNITVVGTGYVGLVTGTCLADVGNDVICIDSDQAKIRGLIEGRVPIYEPGLEPMVLENYNSGRLRFSTDVREGIDFADIIFIAVGTPPDEDGSADLKYIIQVANSIGEHISGYKVVVNKSTVPVGTAEKVRLVIAECLRDRGADVEFSVVSNPEFLKEGAAIEDFMKPDRIVVGVEDERAEELMRELYQPFSRNHEKMMVMDVTSAELTKYAANAMLATKISFMNEMANLAEKLGADIESVRQGIGSDPRIGYHFIYPGCGYGGSCFPKDVKALIRIGSGVDYAPRVLEAVEEVNERQKRVLVAKIDAHFGADLSGKRFALWGLAFKPNTDDMREAPSRVIMEAIWTRGGSVAAFDPVATEEAARIYGDRRDLSLEAEDPYQVLTGADALILVTEWKVFRSPNLRAMRERMRAAVIFDGRNVFDPAIVRRSGFDYYGIGR
ncbi:MAG: UDP-glucose/GDP-mannose dehydrogenase family protein [Proteobacteria bacterium]|nr:MAG: UDP-glucose/GDP-mannose dehydrogenase family protein [Pseudomonadota bacterium]